VPRFSQIYGANVTHLSFTTKILLNLGQFFQHYGLFVFLLFMGVIALIISLLSRQEIRTSMAKKILHLPLIGEKIRTYYLSQLYRTLAMLLKSGIPIVSGLTMVADILTPTLQAQLNQAKRFISEGQSFTEVFSKCNLTTMVAYRLFKVGEKTGNLEEMMEKVAFFHEQEILRSVDKFLKLFEPILIAVIGFFIGGIVVMLYLPIFELASGLQ
jgi:general secretion pathway protein F